MQNSSPFPFSFPSSFRFSFGGLSGHCQGVVRALSGCCQGIVRVLSGVMSEGNVRGLSEGCPVGDYGVVTGLPRGSQGIAKVILSWDSQRKLPAGSQGVVRVLSRGGCQGVVTGLSVCCHGIVKCVVTFHSALFAPFPPFSLPHIFIFNLIRMQMS